MEGLTTIIVMPSSTSDETLVEGAACRERPAPSSSRGRFVSYMVCNAAGSGGGGGNSDSGGGNGGCQ